MKTPLRRLLLHGGLLSVLSGLIILAPAAPADMTDLYLATSTVSLAGNPASPDPAKRAAAWRSAKVVSLDGSKLLPYTEANLKANQFRAVVGRVDRNTGRPVGALAVNKNSCDAGAGGRWRFCIGVAYHYVSGGSRLTALTVKLEDFRSPTVCDKSLRNNGRTFTVWRNVRTVHARASSGQIRKYCSSSPATVETFYYRNGADRTFPRQTRFHPTASQYSDAVNGHPVVWLR